MASACDMIPDAALVVSYLRRLGFKDDEAARHATTRPLASAGSSSKALLSELVGRHLLRIPFATLERQSAAEACNSSDARSRAARVAFGVGGGDCFDLNPAFAWVLTQLGATARLCLAVTPSAEGFSPEPTRCVVLVTLQGETFLVDPGSEDPPRTAINIATTTSDDLDSFEVCDSVDAPEGFDKTLQRRRGGSSLARHLWDPDNSALDVADTESTAVYAFRSSDDLEHNAEELQAALRAAVAEEAGTYAQKILCLATPRGHSALSSKCMRRVERGAVVEEIQVQDDAHWEKLAGDLLALPLLEPPGVIEAAPRAKRPSEVKRMSSADGKSSGPPSWLRNASGQVSGQMIKSATSQSSAAAKSQNLGTVDAKSLAVGGAGQGGGLGLNAPGFGPKVQHFASGGAGTKKAAIDVAETIRQAWARVQDDADPLSWVFCEYKPDGRALELKSQGDGGLAQFKQELGETIAWGGFRCYGVDKRGGLECKRPKFIFVQYKPEAASAIKKAKQASHKGDVKDAICGAHIDVSVETLADLDEQGLINKLQAATGAHKPNGYEFDAGEFMEADYYGLGIGKNCKAESAKN